jgi:uncharacterized protein (DUF433 family)
VFHLSLKMVHLQPDRYLDVRGENDVRIAGTRVGLEHVLEAYRAGAAPEALAIEFPSVTLEQVHGVIAYYLRHRVEVDQYLQAWHRSSLTRQREPQEVPAVVERLRQMVQSQVPQ